MSLIKKTKCMLAHKYFISSCFRFPSIAHFALTAHHDQLLYESSLVWFTMGLLDISPVSLYLSPPPFLYPSFTVPPSAICTLGDSPIFDLPERGNLYSTNTQTCGTEDTLLLKGWGKSLQYEQQTLEWNIFLY